MVKRKLVIKKLNLQINPAQNTQESTSKAQEFWCHFDKLVKLQLTVIFLPQCNDASHNAYREDCLLVCTPHSSRCFQIQEETGLRAAISNITEWLYSVAWLTLKTIQLMWNTITVDSSKLVGSWFTAGLKLVWSWFEAVLELVRSWIEAGSSWNLAYHLAC